MSDEFRCYHLREGLFWAVIIIIVAVCIGLLSLYVGGLL